MLPGHQVVISLDSQPERRARFLDRWAAATGGAPIDVFPALDMPHDVEQGCYLSHLAVLDAFAHVEGLLVLEDDAVFTPAFRLDQPTPPPDWWLLRPGAHAPDPGRPNPIRIAALALVGAPYADFGVWQSAPYIFKTHAYIARQPAALATGVRARTGRNISTCMARDWPGHYRAWPPTVTQEGET